MSATTTHAGEAHEHHRFQAHHFDTAEQQFQAGKLGMWLFLATEVLFFSGMFCAYSVYRVNHPEVFEFAHQFLNPTLGMINTIVLLASSLSVAWSVRCAQLNKQTGLLANLMFTVVCAGVFMGIKSVEYTLKFYEGLLWRGEYSFHLGEHPDLAAAHQGLQTFGLTTLGVGAAIVVAGLILGAGSRGIRWAFFALGATVLGAGVGCLAGNLYTAYHENQPHAAGEPALAGGEQHALAGGEQHALAGGEQLAETSEAHAPPAREAFEEIHATDHPEAETTPIPTTTEFTEEEPPYGGEGPQFPGVFFSIYYAMTGVHAIHILGGIGVFVWIISRAARGHFEPTYYGPVEYVGLYWHLVDLIWIYLFPLLYLIQ